MNSYIYICVCVCVCVNKIECSVKILKFEPHYNQQAGVNVKIILKTRDLCCYPHCFGSEQTAVTGFCVNSNEHLG